MCIRDRYGIFQSQAEKMGKAQWVQQLTGQTAEAVKMFKTTGSEMSGAFTSLGANAQSNGIKLSEQMAILGTLQATMSGSEAGTKYKSFLAGVASAQDKLGLSFTDSQGRMLPMLDILQKLKGKFGDTLDVAEGDALKKAFGSEEAVSLVKLLMAQTDGLAKSIGKIDMITGMDNAAKMAQSMVDPWDQFGAVTEALRISFGTLLLPTINELIGSLNSGLISVIGWTEEFPNLTRWIGLAALSVLALAGATGIFTILLGLGRTAMAAFGAVVLIGKGIVMGLAFGLKVLRGVMFVLAIATNTALAPMWLVVGIIGAIIAAVGYVIYKIGAWLGWWDKLTSLLQNTSWGAAILDTLGAFGDKISELLSWLGLIDDTNVSVSGTADKALSVTAPEQMPELAALRLPDSSIPSASQSLAGMMGGNGKQFNGINIYSQNPFSPADLDDWSQLEGG